MSRVVGKELRHLLIKNIHMESSLYSRYFTQGKLEEKIWAQTKPQMEC